MKIHIHHHVTFEEKPSPIVVAVLESIADNTLYIKNGVDLLLEDKNGSKKQALLDKLNSIIADLKTTV
jgi:hypothetical protein